METTQNSPRNHPRGDPVSENAQLSSSRSESALESLGIEEPYTPAKSRRRSRRPFTTAEDEALLKGYSVHGFQWTLIQQDKDLSLGHRRATDLRDRFRTKFPHAYRDGGPVRGNALPTQMTKDTALKEGTNRAPKSKQNSQDTKPPSSDGRPSKPEDLTSSTTGAVDPAFPSLVLPAVRESLAGVPPAGFPFPLDEGPTNVASVDLPPLIWDDLA